MSEVVYTAKSAVERVSGAHRRAELATGVVIDLGVHGPVKEFYRLAGRDHPLPVDYIVAATGA